MSKKARSGAGAGAGAGAGSGSSTPHANVIARMFADLNQFIVKEEYRKAAKAADRSTCCSLCCIGADGAAWGCEHNHGWLLAQSSPSCLMTRTRCDARLCASSMSETCVAFPFRAVRCMLFRHCVLTTVHGLVQYAEALPLCKENPELTFEKSYCLYRLNRVRCCRELARVVWEGRFLSHGALTYAWCWCYS